jgi:hypothetical protein
MRLGKPNDASPLRGKGKSRKIAHIEYFQFDESDDPEAGGKFFEQYGLRSRTSDGTSEPSISERAEAITRFAKAEYNKLRKRPRKLKAIRDSVHPAASAVTFLELTRKVFGGFAVGQPLEGQDEVCANFRKEIFALCDAWHWLHMEVYGEHLKAVEAKTVRLSGAKVVGARAKMIRAIIKEEVKAVDAREPRKLSRAAMSRRIKDRVHQRCAGQGIAVEHRPKGRTLDDLIGKARK